MRRRSIHPPFRIDLRRTLGPLRHGRNDPTARFAADGFWRATRTPAGTATLHVRAEGTVLEAEAWGDGADWALDAAPALLGCDDDDAGFRPEHPLLRRIVHDLPGLRIGRSAAVLEAMVPAIIEQKVTGYEARRAFVQLVRRFGEPAPGPADLLVPPDPRVLASLHYYELHPLGIERKRADTIRRASAHATRLEAIVDLPGPDARQRLQALPGVGPWTAAETTIVALGDADAVSVGDFHLPNQVAWALAGEPRGDDARMLQLLEPYRGHRGRVARLIVAAGIQAPRRGPRHRSRSIAGI
ncbi:3-methyladenine DNA glycosylase [soil metagenome]